MSVERRRQQDCAHRSVDAVLALPELRPDAIASVRVEVPTGSGSLSNHRPTRGAEARLSLEHCVAAAIIDRRVVPQSFTDQAVLRPQIQSMLPKIRVVEVEQPTAGTPVDSEPFAVVTLTRKDGWTFFHRSSG
jgi:2-methylcitrate dehydratase PrpD